MRELMIFLKIESVIAFLFIEEGLALFVKLVFEQSVAVVEHIVLIPKWLELRPMGLLRAKQFV